MKLFKAGIVRILVCTDAAGMVCPTDVDIVVQWKLPGTLSMFIQRAGRAARAQNRKGLAVLLVEKSAYGLDCERLVNKLQGRMSLHARLANTRSRLKRITWKAMA